MDNEEVMEYEEPIDMDLLIGDLTLTKLNVIFQDVMKRQVNKIDPVRSKFGKIQKEEVTLQNDEFTQQFKDLGFPDSYIPYLNYLHQKYPSWQFIPKQTNLIFQVAVDSEEGKNYIQNNNPSFITSFASSILF